MERQIWKKIIDLLSPLAKRSSCPRRRYSDADIVRVVLWAALYDRPISWAVKRENWPSRQATRRLPSGSTVSRRCRHKSVQGLLRQLEAKTLRRHGDVSLVAVVDGKPLPISGFSKDKQAGYGRAAGCKAKGYKLHVLFTVDGSLLGWRVAPMNKDERVMARRLVRSCGHQGYLLGDGNFDSNPLHAACSEVGQLQLVAPRRRGGGLGHGRHDAGRLRSIELLEGPCPEFGRSLLKIRDTVERFFASLTNWGGSLTCLPAWARTHHRVHRWVQAKLLINALKPRTYDR